MSKKLYQNYVYGHLDHLQNLDLGKVELKYFEKNYLKLLPNEKDIKILELGCGTGKFLLFLEKHGFKNITGVDIGKEQIEYCKKKGLNVIKSDVLDFLKKKRKFDVIVMNDLIEHFRKKEILLLLSRLYNSLNKNGILILKTGNMANPILGISCRFSDFTHETGFTERSIYQILNHTGFNKIIVSPEKLGSTKIRAMLAGAIYAFFDSFFKLIFKIYGRRISIIASKDLIVKCEK